MSDTSMDTLDDLRRHLQGAIALEHATMPPYLCALYSIHPGTNEEAVDVIASVVVEEMLHMTLAANLLNAIGGTPVVADASVVATFPTALPHSDESFIVSLSRFSPATVETFMRVEKPEVSDAPPEADRFETIGQFYRAIEDGLTALCASLGEGNVFCGDPSRQVTPDTFAYDGSGRIVAVTDLASALVAIDEIEEQGEGLKHAEVWDGDRDMFHPDRDEVAHYFRFGQLLLGRSYRRGDTPQSGPTGDIFDVDWDAVYPMRDNPRVEDLPAGSPARAKAEEFRGVYSDTLRTLECAFNGEPDRLNEAISQMMELRDRSRELVAMPSGDGVTNAGPVFEYVEAAEAPAPNGSHVTITVRKDGPYVVEGGPPVVRKHIVKSELEESMYYQTDVVVAADRSFRLCRCGQSSHKPFCDGTHAKVGFDGTETASTEPSASRRQRFPGPAMTLTDDNPLCISAAFCHNNRTDVWEMVQASDDTEVRFALVQRIESCPSGRLILEIEGSDHEPDLPLEVGVLRDGPYWVTGGATVVMSDGRTLEVRNRMALCRCGHSKNKPLCDGSHEDVEFTDG
ncbi:MAG: ferritin-like domain-containing protein [Acidimicrobiales bacterium]